MASVLVVEDDQFVRSALIRQLTDAAHTVRSVGTALEALREVAHVRFDVVVLDLGLPDLDGSEALKMLRGVTDVPVIIATARDDEAEIVRLLNAGADDYLTKPFSVEHLCARMAAVLRRARAGGGETPASPVLRVGGLTVDPLRRQAELDGVRLDLTRREFDLLAFLAARPGVVVPRRELLAEVWRQSYGDDQTIDVHLSWLRRKLGETAARPRYLHTLRGVGVKLEPPAPESSAHEHSTRGPRMTWPDRSDLPVSRPDGSEPPGPRPVMLDPTAAWPTAPEPPESRPAMPEPPAPRHPMPDLPVSRPDRSRPSVPRPAAPGTSAPGPSVHAPSDHGSRIPPSPFGGGPR